MFLERLAVFMPDMPWQGGPPISSPTSPGKGKAFSARMRLRKSASCSRTLPQNSVTIADADSHADADADFPDQMQIAAGYCLRFS